MNNPKQVREIIFLCVAIAVLAIVAVVSFKGANTQPASPPPQRVARTAGAKTPGTAVKKPAAKAAEWVDEGRLVMLVSEVHGGRNPFQSLMATPNAEEKATPPKPQVPQVPMVDPIPQSYGGGRLPGIDEVPIDVQRAVTLQWITRQQLLAKIKPEFPDVRVEAGKRADQVKLIGSKLDIDEVVAMLPSIDIEPATPPFHLVGVITNSAQSFAIISLDGNTYSVNKGEVIPSVGWVITEITPTGVTLKKGKQIKSLRLAGGKA